jgi:hypothetical protein
VIKFSPGTPVSMVFNATFTTIKNMVGLWCLTPLSTQLKKYGWFMVFNATFNTIKNMVGLWVLLKRTKYITTNSQKFETTTHQLLLNLKFKF